MIKEKTIKNSFFKKYQNSNGEDTQDGDVRDDFTVSQSIINHN
jgi:hypothetical protein